MNPSDDSPAPGLSLPGPSVATGVAPGRSFITAPALAAGISASWEQLLLRWFGWVANAPQRPASRPPSHRVPSSFFGDGGTKMTVRCHHCGTSHHTFDHAEATGCPGCGRTISLQDVVIHTHTCRPVDTRGHLRIERQGNLYSPLTVCGQGLIAGTISGELHCEGLLTLPLRGTIPAKIEAEEVFIPVGAEVRCPFPIRAGRITVRGHLLANVVVRQELHILRRGEFEGTVWSRAVKVDRGGELLGSVNIGPTEAPRAGLPEAREMFCSLRSALTGRHSRRRPSYS